MVYIFLAEGFEEIEAVTITDILRRGEVDAQMVSIGDRLEVKGAHGLTVTADLLFDEIDEAGCEMAVLPGGMPGTTNLQAHRGLGELITRMASQNKWVCAICAAPMVLGSCGILKGRQATIFPGMEAELTGATPKPDAVVRDGKVITSRAPGTAMVFGLALVEALRDAETAAALREDLHMAV